MRAWIILGTVLVLLFLLSLVRVGGVLEYSAQGLLVRIRLGRLRLTVFPMRKRARKPRPPQEKNPANRFYLIQTVYRWFKYSIIPICIVHATRSW